MKPYRRFQPVPPYGYCLEPGCPWKDEGDGEAVECAGRDHLDKTGHAGIRANLWPAGQLILRPAQPAAAAS